MERGGKYGEGSRGNLKLWQSQKSGMDSFLYRVDENMTASTYSLNKIPERNLESMSSHSAHSIPLYLMPRPNSVAGESLPLSPKNTPVKVYGGRNKVIKMVHVHIVVESLTLKVLTASFQAYYTIFLTQLMLLTPSSFLSSLLSLLVFFLD